MTAGRMLLTTIALTLAVGSGGAEVRLDCPDGWTQLGAARSFIDDTLFEYMNGNAEGYLIYGFETMDGISCERDGIRLHIDISTMESPDAAWGLYASNRDPLTPEVELGAVGQILDSRAFFVRDRYFVELAAEPAAGPEELSGPAAVLDSRLSGGTALPAALSWFPGDGMRRSTLRMVPQSVLGISTLRRGYLAEYESGARAFIALESSDEAAAKVLDALRARWGETVESAVVGDDAITASDRYLGQILVFRKGSVVAGAVGKEPGPLPELVSRIAAAIP